MIKSQNINENKGNRGHRSYGEYIAYQKGTSWKAMLAADIADCLQHAKSKVDFFHRLDERGIDVDIGRTSTLFTIQSGTYGLKSDRKCGDKALISYGDFSSKNIMNYFQANKGLLELALDDFTLLQDAFLEVGRMLFPNNPTELQDRYFSGMEFADFDRMTRDEIESYLKRKKLEQIQKKALAEREQQSQGGGMMLACIADTLELILQHLKERHIEDYFTHDYKNEYEL